MTPEVGDLVLERRSGSPGPAAAYYESPAAVSHFLTRYNAAKEAAFCRFIARLAGPHAEVLEVGGGPGLHGSMLKPLVRSYTHTDLSTAMCVSARALGLDSIRMDALRPTLTADTILAVELSTIRGKCADTRRRQLQALAATGRRIIISTGRADMHSLDRQDVAELSALGFLPERWTTWGASPAAAWSNRTASILEFLEACAGRTGCGVRRVAVFTKAPERAQ